MKRVKSVAFNMSDPMEYALYQYAHRHKYFSTYVKRLIQRDMEDGTKENFAEYQQGFEEYNSKEEDEK